MDCGPVRHELIAREAGLDAQQTEALVIVRHGLSSWMRRTGSVAGRALWHSKRTTARTHRAQRRHTTARERLTSCRPRQCLRALDEFVQSDRQIPDALAGGVIDRVADG